MPVDAQQTQQQTEEPTPAAVPEHAHGTQDMEQSQDQDHDAACDEDTREVVDDVDRFGGHALDVAHEARALGPDKDQWQRDEDDQHARKEEQ